ncbi:WD repeat-containing protein 62 [Aphelenchoides avenae]|nr:WD repeat-containing protein 62 [Aphelenchus avenae]
MGVAKLERVIGSTQCSSSISVDPVSGLVAYPAGSTVVVHNPKTLQQAHLISRSKNHITSLAFSPDGRYVATGEFGHEPKVRVWELHRDGQHFGQQLAELKGHSFGISCVAFSKDSTQVISVGNQHDKSVVVWDWRQKRKLAENRLTSHVYAMDVSDDGNMFVTVGVRHVKFWFLEKWNNSGSAAVQGRTAILAEHRNNTFVDVCCAPNKRAFAITVTKLLVVFDDKKLVSTYELQGEMPHTLTMGSGFLYVGFDNGTVRAFDPDTMEVRLRLSQPHFLQVDVASDTLKSANEMEAVAMHKYPDVHSLVYHEATNTITVVYSDRSIYQWQVTGDNRYRKISSQLFHVGAIFDLELLHTSNPALPAGTIFTAGSDETVRVWNVDRPTSSNTSAAYAFSQELRKILYLGHGADALHEQPSKTFGAIVSDTIDATTGVRCLRISMDGMHLAVGERNGNLSIFDVSTPAFSKVITFEAHEGEVMCLDYNDPSKNEGQSLLASGGRDRLVHLLDASNGYSHLAVLDDHSSSIVSLKFVNTADSFKLITAGTDKVVIIRRLTYDAERMCVQSERINQVCTQPAPNYITILPGGNILAACQDRQLRTYTDSGKLLRTVQGTLCEDGTLTKLCVDPSGTYAATVCSDRFVYIVEVATGECVAVLSGQSESVTSIGFTPDCRRLIVVSYSGCIFIWRLSNVLTKQMISKLSGSAAATLSAADVVSTDRTPTPDSVIESGSDSASVNGKKDPRATGSEFGSLASLNVVQEDDLDSGVGGAARFQPNAIVVDAPDFKEQSPFEVKRLPSEVVRRSNSNLLAAQASNYDLHSEGGDAVSDAGEKENDMYSTSASSRRAPPGHQHGYAASRSMSNLHRANASPHRQRRRWAIPAPEDASKLGYYQHEAPTYNDGQHDATAESSFYMAANNTSLSLNALRSALENGSNPPMTSTPKSSQAATSSPYAPEKTYAVASSSGHGPTAFAPYGASPGTVAAIRQNHFERGNSRNSLSKRYLTHLDPKVETQTLWTPSPVAKESRQPQSAPFATTPQRPVRRQWGSNPPLFRARAASASTLELERFESSGSSNSTFTVDKPTTEVTPPSVDSPRPCQRRLRRRWNWPAQQESDYATSDLHLRSRSQSPSQLALQLAAVASHGPSPQNAYRKLSSVQRRREQDSDAGSTSRMTPASSRTNLHMRASSTMTSSSQALDKLLEVRQRLKKSQENLAITSGLDDASEQGRSSSSMSRSRSIGNLRFSAARTETPHNNTFGGLGSNEAAPVSSPLSDAKRHMARSVNALNTTEQLLPQHPDDFSLRTQYAAGFGDAQVPVGRTAQSVRAVKRLSNSNLASENLYSEQPAAACDRNLYAVDEHHTTDESSPYQSMTLPKNIRKGAVQKRVERNQPRKSKLSTIESIDATQNTTSADSDSNASDAPSPFNGLMASPYSRSPMGQIRSVSSVENGGRLNRRGPYDPSGVVARKAPNYLAQRLGSAEVAPDLSHDDPSSRSLPSSASPTSSSDSDYHGQTSKKLSLHAAECIEQMTQACDKLLGARHLIENDTTVTTADKERLLKSVNKSINQFRVRLENALPEDRTFSDMTNASHASNAGGSVKLQSASGRPSNISDTGNITTSGVQSDDPIDGDFIMRNGPRLMQLLQAQMAAQNTAARRN